MTRKQRKAQMTKEELNDAYIAELKAAVGLGPEIHLVASHDPEIFYQQIDQMEDEYAAALAHTKGLETPKTRKRALEIDMEQGNTNWRDSMKREHDRLVERGTWHLVPISKIPIDPKTGKRHILPSVWRFKHWIK